MSAYALVCEADGAGEAVAVAIPTCRWATEGEIRSDLAAWVDGVVAVVRRQQDTRLKESAQAGAAAAYRELHTPELLARLPRAQGAHQYWVVYTFSPAAGPITGESAGLLFALALTEELAKQAHGKPLEFSYAATGIIDADTGAIGRVSYLTQKLTAALRTLGPGDKLFYPPPEHPDPAEWRWITTKAQEQNVQLCPVRTVRTAIHTLLGLPDMEVRILQPAPDQIVPYGAPICLQGIATDAEDGPLEGRSLVWHSQRDGELGTGNTVCTVWLTRGPHTLTLTATNARGLSATATVRLRVHRRIFRLLPAAVCSGFLAALSLEYLLSSSAAGGLQVEALRAQVAALQAQVAALQGQSLTIFSGTPAPQGRGAPPPELATEGSPTTLPATAQSSPRAGKPSEATPKEKPQKSTLLVSDTQGVQTPLSEYGIIYRPFSANSLRYALREGIIVERGEGGETFRWDTIKKVERLDTSQATITLTNGKTIDGVRLRGGTFVGETEDGGTLVLSLSAIKTIEFPWK